MGPATNCALLLLNVNEKINKQALNITLLLCIYLIWISYKVNKLPLYMARTLVKSSIIFCSILFFLSCRQNRTTERAFYYWKSNFKTGTNEQEALRELQVKKLYVKFFDVAWDARLERPYPLAQISFDTVSLNRVKQQGIEIIPAVFITNETLEQIRAETVPELAERINFLLKELLMNNAITDIREIQIDCDWTASTKEKYFELLRQLKILPLFLERQLSATIRLYQCKYHDKTGIPPVNKGLLMCYNMGNLKNPGTNNSIIEADELSKYIGNLNAYPLPLDIAFPLFEWKVLFRNNAYAGLIQALPDSLLNKPGIFSKNANRFELQVDTVLQGYELKKGDVLRREESSFEEIIQSIKVLSPQLATPNFTISLYHLDSLPLSKFKKDELEAIYNSLH
jgi:hypothetical protein